MKKIINSIVKLTAIITILLTSITTTYAASNEESIKIEKLLSYPAYSTFSEKVEVVDTSWIENSTYEEVKAYLHLDLKKQIEKIKQGEDIYWVPDFVLNIVKEEFPDLFDEIYRQLIDQGYNPVENISHIVEFDSPQTRTSSYTLQNVAHGLVFQSEQYIAWTVVDDSIGAGTTYSISLVKATPTGGWFCWAHTATISMNHTSGAYGYYVYGEITNDMASWVANVGLKVSPKTNGNAYQAVVYENIDAAGDPWTPPTK